MAVNEMFFEKYLDTMLEHQIQVRPYDVEKTTNMRSLNPEGKIKNLKKSKWSTL
jgi:DNA replication licensing factor MCM4